MSNEQIIESLIEQNKQLTNTINQMAKCASVRIYAPNNSGNISGGAQTHMGGELMEIIKAQQALINDLVTRYCVPFNKKDNAKNEI